MLLKGFKHFTFGFLFDTQRADHTIFTYPSLVLNVDYFLLSFDYHLSQYVVAGTCLFNLEREGHIGFVSELYLLSVVVCRG